VLVELPIVLPPTVAGLALLLLYGQRGALGTVLNTLEIRLAFTTTAVIFAQVFISAPFYIRAAQSSFESIPPEIEEAACVDGAGGVALFRWITLPLAWNGLAAGLTLSWARALGEFGATVLFAGNLSGVTQTLTLFINTEWESNLESAVWASMILLGLAFVALTVSGWFSRRQAY
jgi:molybdate transport system permease protein